METNGHTKKRMTLEELDLKYVAKGGMVKMIKWGHGYEKWGSSAKIEYLEALASAMNEAARIAYEERDQAWERVDFLTKGLTNADTSVGMNKDLMKKSFERNNDLIQENAKLANEVLALKKRLGDDYN